MKRFNARPQRTDEYIIEIDENVWNDDALKEWGNVFWELDGIEDLVEAIAMSLLRDGYERFIEGFGYLYTMRRGGYHLKQYEHVDGDFREVTEFAKGIKVTIVSEDDEFECEVEEI